MPLFSTALHSEYERFPNKTITKPASGLKPSSDENLVIAVNSPNSNAVYNSDPAVNVNPSEIL